MNEPINASVASQNTGGKLHKKVFERIKESKWGTSCKFMWIKHSQNKKHR